jgi:hypothetical protein
MFKTYHNSFQDVKKCKILININESLETGLIINTGFL